MKKRFSVLLAVLVTMMVFVSNVLAAPAESKSVKLVSVTYQHGGIVLIFETSGLTKDDLKNHTFVATSTQQDMYCNFVDDSAKVRCVISKGLAGQGDFHGSLAGFAFSGKLPEARSFSAPSCPTGQVLWYYVNEYFSGILHWSGQVPAWMWNQAAADGSFVKWASQGKTYSITGSFCAPDSSNPI